MSAWNENPVVVTNQPRGSLTLSVTLTLKMPPGSRVKTDAIEAALAQVDELMAGQGAPGHVVGVEFQFDPASSSGITLRGANESDSGPTSRPSSTEVVRCVSGSKRRMLSSVSPKNSRRTGWGESGGNRSSTPPRRANCPGATTGSSRR